MNYYNENDPRAVAWLRELIAQKQIPEGIIDERSVIDVKPEDVRGFAQCHFFAGVGGWSEALRLAGWPIERPVWTGSCPCQPFSCAGKQLGEKDARHLWPEFKRLIAEAQPARVFGEQVASKAGRVWLSGIRTDLEALAYAVGASDLCAAGIGAPHIRQRLFWMADGSQREGRSLLRPGEGFTEASERTPNQFRGSGDVSRLVHSIEPGLERHAGNGNDWSEPGRNDSQPGGSIASASAVSGGASLGCWSEYGWIECLDGKKRRTQSGLFPLADGVPGRVGLLRGYGNAIVPLLAAEFIQAAELALQDFNQL